jgi:hypothetical protein
MLIRKVLLFNKNPKNVLDNIIINNKIEIPILDLLKLFKVMIEVKINDIGNNNEK